MSLSTVTKTPLGEMADERPPSAFFDLRKLKGILQHSREQAIHVRFKPESEAWALALISKRRLEDLELGLRRDVEAPHHYAVRRGARTLPWTDRRGGCFFPRRGWVASRTAPPCRCQSGTGTPSGCSEK